MDELTPRERRVMEMICMGLSNKEVAKNMNIQPYTVGSHLKSIYRKLGTRNRVEAVVIMLNHERARDGRT